jgi:hypothetical protein
MHVGCTLSPMLSGLGATIPIALERALLERRIARTMPRPSVS